MAEFINTKKEIAWGNWYFTDHVMAPEFNVNARRKEKSAYFAKYGFDVSMMYDDYFSRLSGISSDQYFSMDLYYLFVLPCLNRYDFLEAYSDKNMFSLLFSGVNQPQTVVKSRNGIFYDVNERVVGKKEAISICLNSVSEKGFIIKPTVETCNGDGVASFDNSDPQVVCSQLDSRGRNFIVQKKVVQHHEMARLNSSSLNACRILTYRDLTGNIRYVKGKSFLRIGGKGAVVDNVSSGGGMCHLNDDGTVSDVIVKYKTMKLFSLLKDFQIENFRVPNFDKAIDFACELHQRLSYFDFIGWDIAIDCDGKPLMIEFNARPGTEATQQGSGPMMGDFLDEVMDRVKRVRRTERKFIINSFDRPGYNYYYPIA